MTQEDEISAPGRLLSGGSLMGALNESRIFREGSWSESRIKGAGYEIRLSDDWIACPEKPGSTTIRITQPGDQPIPSFVLAPGDTAVVASTERFCLDFDISCQIGPKFRWAAQGLQVLHGFVAHPGYGKTVTSEGWVDKPDERLYLVLVNIGPDDIELSAGVPILYTQFFAVERIVPLRDIENVGFSKLISSFMGGSGRSVPYYRAVSDLRDSLNIERAKLDSRVDAADVEFQELKRVMDRRLELVERSVSRTTSAVELVVVFGVFLVTATLLGLVYSGVVDAIKTIPSTTQPAQLTLVRWMTVLFGVLVTGVASGVFLAVRRTFASRD